MESLADTKWDVVISGTGFQQSLLALALSRSGKKLLHIDPNEYYGGAESALSLQEAEEWAEEHADTNGTGVFAAAQVFQDAKGLASSRSYSLALAPQMIHARSALLKQLVSSRAFRQIEFLAVGSFFIFQPSASPTSKPILSRIPSTREDIFSNTAIPTRSKRLLMKFLKFVLDYNSEPQIELWRSKESEPLAEFLKTEFKLDSDLQSYVETLALSHDGQASVGVGLAAIHRHLSSMGVFGPGFAAVYPKWGGLSEVAQVGCRAGAVGGAVYMLGVGVSGVQSSSSGGASEVEIALTNDVTVKSKFLVRNPGEDSASDSIVRMRRLVAIVNSPLAFMFEATVEGAPIPCVAVVAFPVGFVSDEEGTRSRYPIYAMIHSSDTGECPAGQCVVYLSTPVGSASQALLDRALSLLLIAASESEPAKCLWRLHYEQACKSGRFTVDNNIGSFDCFAPDLAFNDTIMEPVRHAWQLIAGPVEEADYMQFEDRERFDDDDDAF